MKRSSLFTRKLKPSLLAMPAAALMLGAAHAGTSVGINFSASYYGGGTYASTAVLDTAFGIGALDWFSTPLDATNSVMTVTPSNGGSFGVAWTANYTSISWANGSGMPGYVGYPGDTNVYQGNIAGPYTVSLSGLAAQFPHGYAVQALSAANNPAVPQLPITITDGVSTNTALFTSRGQFDYGWGIAGIYGYYSPTTTLLTNDTLTSSQTNQDTTVNQSWLSGFIITDKPVVSMPPAGASLATGNTLSLATSVVGVGPLHYQWRTNGVPIPGANSAAYTKANVSAADAANYDLVVTNSSGSVTSVVAVVSVAVPATLTWDANPGNGGTLLDGSGNWDSTTTNWWNGASDVAWSAYSFARFGGGGGGSYSVTLNNNVIASGLSFNNGNYSIENATGVETITMAGAQGISFSNDTEIDLPLAGNSGLNINGTGTLTLTAYNTYTGVTTVSNGTLNLPTAISGANSSLKTSVINLLPGTALNCNYGAFGYFANNNASGLTININGATCQPNGALGVAYTLTGGSIAGGSARLDLGAAGGFNTAITTYPSATTSVINPTAGNVTLREDSFQTNYLFTVAAGVTPSGIDLDVQVPFHARFNSAVLIKAGVGTLRISGANTYGGATIVSNGTLVVDGSVSSSALVLNPGTTTVLVMNRAAGTYASLQGMSTATYGGTLIVTNVGGTFQNGDSFSLFNAASYSGSFSSVTLPTLPSGLSWSWSPSTGVLSAISAVGPPMLTWDANPGNGGTLLDGSGSWDSTTANWWNGSSDVAWTPAATADFGGGVAGSYTVTLNNNVTASGLAFNSGNYTLVNNTGAEAVTLAASSAGAPAITYSNNTEIDAILAGTSGVIINGTGTLTLTPLDTYTGPTTVSNGTLNLPTAYSGANTSLKTSAINLLPGTALTCNYNTFGWYANNNAIGLTININGATCQPNGAFGVSYTLTGGSIVGGTGRLDLGGYAGFTATVTTYPSATTSVINPGGGYVIFRNDSGQTNYTFNVAAGTTTNGIDLDVPVYVRQNTATCSLIKTGAGTLRLSGANTYTGTTTVSNGTLLVNGALATNTVTVSAPATLGGTGTIGGAVKVSGTLAPGLGTLKITNALTLNAGSALAVAINRGVATGSVQGVTTATLGGNLVVTNAGGAFQNGDTFTLVSAATYTGNFSATNLPTLTSGLAWSWSPTTGVLSVVPGSSGPSLNPTNIMASVSGGNLKLTWPTDHTGWRLLTQTNKLSSGISINTNDWTTVIGSTATNSVTIPLDATKPGGYYRLVYP